MLADRLRRARGVDRLRILLALGDGARSPDALDAEFGGGHPVASQHLALLQDAGRVESGSDGRRDAYTLTDAGRQVLRVVAALGG